MKNKRAAKAKAKRRKEKADCKTRLDRLPPTEIIMDTVEFDTMMWLYVLHEKFGFGKTRLERALHERDELGDAVNLRYLDFNDIAKVLRDEVKMNI